ncbi:hypothetical protein [Tenacibaculum sp. 190524A05c]|uniref:Uncharacterized protein n=1 Tax=Tenacibaculum platacis TaxID=3137852 RepID=A0ABM9NWV9_9FLAO
MINIFDLFDEKLIFEELGDSPIRITTPKSSVRKSKLKLKELFKNTLFPNSLSEMYNQISHISILWNIVDEEESSVNQFKEDKWLKEKYLDNGYDWGVVNEYLSGFINITKSEEIFNADFCKNQGYYYTLSNREENPDDFFPLDICWDLTACVKKEGNEILNNIWLVHTNANEIYDMKINIEEYLNLCYKAKGFHYWQLIYLFKTKSEYYELMKRFLPKMLPHINLDLSDFDIEL